MTFAATELAPHRRRTHRAITCSLFEFHKGRRQPAVTEWQLNPEINRIVIQVIELLSAPRPDAIHREATIMPSLATQVMCAYAFSAQHSAFTVKSQSSESYPTSQEHSLKTALQLVHDDLMTFG